MGLRWPTPDRALVKATTKPSRAAEEPADAVPCGPESRRTDRMQERKTDTQRLSRLKANRLKENDKIVRQKTSRRPTWRQGAWKFFVERFCFL